jgi:hypothetical protein
MAQCAQDLDRLEFGLLNLFLESAMPLDEPQGWRELWEMAQQEQDTKKLAAIIDQMNQLLTEHEKRAADDPERIETDSRQPPRG